MDNKKKETLLEKAKAKKLSMPKGKIRTTDEHIELAFAWLKDEVRLKQISEVCGKKNNGNILYSIAVWLREAYRQGKLKIVNRKL